MLGNVEAMITRYAPRRSYGSFAMARNKKKAALRRAASASWVYAQRGLLPLVLIWLGALHLFGEGIDPNFP
jgi:hypothetical protein